MLMTLDHWLTRFFGASRRAGRAAPMAQRAAFGHDGMDLRQIDSFEFRSVLAPEWDEAPAPAPYAPYVRKPRALSPSPSFSARIRHGAGPSLVFRSRFHSRFCPRPNNSAARRRRRNVRKNFSATLCRPFSRRRDS